MHLVTFAYHVPQIIYPLMVFCNVMNPAENVGARVIQSHSYTLLSDSTNSQVNKTNTQLPGLHHCILIHITLVVKYVQNVDPQCHKFLDSVKHN